MGGGVVRAAVCALLVVALWAVTRPYEGYVHDAQLYLVQALHRLEPARYAADLFFAYGSQDGYSVSSALYAPLVAALGESRAHLVALVVGYALWLSGLWVLARTIFASGSAAAAAVLAVIALVPIYNPGALHYGESSVSPRLYVEATSFFAIAAICLGRNLAAGVLLVCAFALHPIMTLPTLALVAVLRFRLTVLLAVAAAGLGAVLALAFAGIDPFVRILQRMDAEWFGVVQVRTPAALVQNWILPACLLLVFPVVSCGLVALRGTPMQARLARAVLLLCPALVLTSWLAGEVLMNLLFLNLQLWRGLWLLTLAGNCLVPAAYALLPREGGSRGLFLAAVVVNLCEARFGIAVMPFASAGFALASACTLAAAGGGRWFHSAARIGGSAFAAVATLLFLGEVAAVALQPRLLTVLDVLQRVALVLAGGALLVLAARRGRQIGVVLPVLALGVAVWAGLLADQRTNRMAFLTGAAPVDPAFVAATEGKTVYWEGGLEFLWFRLRQPSYFSCYQAAGSMFFRGTAIEHARRAAVLRRLNTSDFAIEPDAFCPQRADPLFEGPARGAQLADVCRALPELDVLVLRADLPDVPHLRWQPGFDVPASGMPVPPKDARPVYVPGKPRGFYNLYRCADLR